MRLFTWYDIEVELKKNRKLWPLWWNRVDVYSDEIVVNIDPKRNVEEENDEIFKGIFGKLYTDGKVMVEFDQKLLEVIYEEGDESDRIDPIKSPLFKDIYTKEEGEIGKGDLPGKPIIAFHSYKGGVGRTDAGPDFPGAGDVGSLWGSKKSADYRCGSGGARLDLDAWTGDEQ